MIKPRNASPNLAGQAAGVRASSQVTPLARLRRHLPALAVHCLLAGGAIIFLLPYYWMVLTSLRPPDQVHAARLDLVPTTLSLATYQKIFSDATITIGRWFVNSLIIATGATLLNLSVSHLAAFALARRPPPGGRLIFFAITATLMVPGEVVLIGMFFLVNRLGLLNSYPGIILPLAVHAVVFLILYNYVKEIPRELEEAAMIDGASTWQVFLGIITPLSFPALSAGAMLEFLHSWQAFTIPYLLVTTNDMYPLSVAILFQETELYSTVQETLTLATVLSLPAVLLFLLTQRRVFDGITAGAVKK